jgi:lipopolysaccharide export LptBFGC system permease protein LptF
MKIIEPYFIFDSDQAKKSAIRRTATNIIAGIKDDKGIRKNFIVKDKNQNSRAIDVNKSKNIKYLKKIKEHLKKNRNTTDMAIWKINSREKVLSGQLSIKDIKAK